MGHLLLRRRGLVFARCFSSSSDALWPVMRPPVNAVTALLDSAHSFSGAPWWLVLIGSTVAMKAALFPVTLLQLRKLASLAEFSKKCPMIPQPGSGKSVLEHFQEFTRKRKEFNVPSPAWFVAAPAVQVPVFVSWFVTVRHMAVNKHPGFESGGALFFSDLTTPIHDHIGVVFPLAIFATYLANVELSWKDVRSNPDTMGSLLTTYRWWLRAFSVPIFISSFYFPQAIFMYWLPNSVTSLAQTYVLRNRSARKVFGLPTLPLKHPAAPTDSDELIKLAAQHLADNDRKKALQILRYVIATDPDNATGYYALAKMHAEAELWAKSAEFFGLAATKAKDDGVRIASHLGHGISMRNQGKFSEAIAALEAVARMDLPENSEIRRSYLMSLVSLGSILNHVGKKVAALEYLKKAAMHDPQAERYVEEVEASLKGEEVAERSERKVTEEI